MPFWDRVLLPRRGAITAAATVVSEVAATTDNTGFGASNLNPPQQSWQAELWGYYNDLGMFRNAVSWKADLMSRVRLRAAVKEPDADEPKVVDTGPAVELVDELTPTMQSQIMSGLATFLMVPGEGYLVGETQDDGENLWMARSIDEIRYRPSGGRRTSTYQIVDESSTGSATRWRDLAPDSLVVRVWRPHKQFHHMPDSPARAARATMREIELANREVQAKYISRLATAGVIIFPQEMSFPVRPEFMDAADPFVEEWIETAAQAIKTPGSAAAAVPIPIRVPGEYIDKVQHLSFRERYEDTAMVAKREAAIKQLAIDLDVPPEALLGMGDVNHWSGWLIEESGFKIYLAPDAELICGALTAGYLQPRLKASGVDDPSLCMWYDASEITQRPDKSQNAKDVYDRMEISGEALRRETGFDEDDAPSDEELSKIAMRIMLKQPDKSATVLETLTGVALTTPEPAQPTPPGDGATQGPPEGQPNEQGPPQGPGEPPTAPTPNDQGTRRADQASLPHAARFELGGMTVLHPTDCADRLMSCPVTHATWRGFVATPGQYGVYECVLDEQGRPVIGHRLLDGDVATMLPGVRRAATRTVNGHRT